jgi:hypothetical protein
MRGDAYVHWCQKLGADPSEYEDAYAVAAAGDIEDWSLTADSPQLRVAVADGATESMLSGRWAAALVQTCTAESDAPMTACIGRAQDAWPQILQTYTAEREADGRPIAWYEQPGLDNGAHATLLLAEFQLAPGGTSGIWTAEAIGDSCLFHLSAKGLKAAFPLSSAEQFDSSPGLVHTGQRDVDLLDKHRRSISGTFAEGDEFYLCTDAVAAWFLARHQAQEKPWTTWSHFSADKRRGVFDEWVATERFSGRLHNDDVTLLAVRFA